MQPMGYAPQPGMPGPPGMAAPAPVATYEFTEMENATLASTARFAKIWGIISLIAGALLLIIGVLMIGVLGAAMATAPASSGSGAPAITPATVIAIGVGFIPSALVSIIGGIFYVMSGNSLSRVVTTQGDDIQQLMGAVQSLTRAFMIEAIALVVSFIGGFVLGLAMQGGH